MVESIAEKEISKDPLDFIRRESFQVGNEEFYSFDGDDARVQKILEQHDLEDDDDDEEEDDNEYHEEEKAVANRIGVYKEETAESIPNVRSSYYRGQTNGGTIVKGGASKNIV